MIRVVIERKDRRHGWREVYRFDDHEHRRGRRRVRYRIRLWKVTP